MTAALIWLIVGLVLVAAEVLSGEFVLLMLGGGALVAAGRGARRRPGGQRRGVRGRVGAAAVRGAPGAAPPAGPRRRRTRPCATEALVGGTAMVVARVDGHGGRVKIGGDEWSARSFDEAQVIEPGEQVTVMRIAGATALVLAHHHPLH